MVKKRDSQEARHLKEDDQDEGEIFYRSYPIAESLEHRIPAVVTGVGHLLERIAWWVIGFIQIVLFLRLIQAFLGANGGNDFTLFVYNVSRPLVTPFFILFDNFGQMTAKIARFEYETLAAMVIYYIVAYIVIQLIRIFRTT